MQQKCTQYDKQKGKAHDSVIPVSPHKASLCDLGRIGLHAHLHSYTRQGVKGHISTADTGSVNRPHRVFWVFLPEGNNLLVVRGLRIRKWIRARHASARLSHRRLQSVVAHPQKVSLFQALVLRSPPTPAIPTLQIL